jgi:hypothetical protein
MLRCTRHVYCHCRLPEKAPASAPTELDDPDLSMPGKISLSDTPIIQADPVMQTGRSHAPSEVSSSPNGTLYDKLGGPAALEAAVDLFYEKVLADERLKHFFEGTNMMRLVIKQVCIHPFIHSIIHSFMHAFIHSFVRSFIDSTQLFS